MTGGIDGGFATGGLGIDERAELRSLAARRGQALALRARIVRACAEGAQNKPVAPGAKSIRDTGAVALSSIASTLCAMSLARVRRTIEDGRIDGVTHTAAHAGQRAP